MNEINNEKKEKKSKSVCFTSIPINAAMKAADELFGTELSYNPINDFQKEYLEKFFDKDDAKYDFVKRIASFKREDIQKFLNENGFPDIIVPSFDPPNYGIAGVMDQIVEWLFEGKSTKMKGQDGNVYDAVQFNAENELRTWCYSANRSSYHSEFVVRIRTKSDDMVFLTFTNTISEDETKFGFEMMELAQKITDESKDWNEDQSLLYMYGDNKLIIPKIDFKGDIYVKWMLGLQCSNGMHLDWAKMKAKLRLNHLGARVQAAFVSLWASTSVPPLKIIKFDRPFMIWFTHQGKVTFAMYVDYEHWKDPGDDIFGDADLKDLGDEQTEREEEKRNIVVYQFNDQKAEFEQLELEEGVELYELLDPSFILLFLDPDNFKSWLWQGSEVSTRMKFISANLAPSIRDQHGMMKIATADDGNERMAFKILVGLEKALAIEDFEPSKLKRLGFWKTHFSSEVEEFMDENWSKTEQKEIVLFYLNSGKFITGYNGSSTCRVCKMRNGSSEYVSPDGKWIYPSGYCHYISDHNVKPPVKLITDALDWYKDDKARVKRIYVEKKAKIIPDLQNFKPKDKKKKNEIADYHGTPLIGYNYNTLMELEYLIGEILSLPPKRPGFQTQDNHIVQLSLPNTRLTSLPESICSLTSLTYLDLFGNKLSSLPERIGDLTSLTYLNLIGTNLSSLPESIGNLTSLEILNFGYNQCTSLPDSICASKSLTELNIGDNNLTSLPESIGNLTSLTSLDLTQNKLTSLPESIGNLTSLETLKLTINNLTSLPDSIGNLTSLTSLDLRQNKLTSLPDSIGNLTSLKTLQLSFNQLTSLPESIGNLTSLFYLDLYGNNLTSLPDGVEKALKRLEENGCTIQGL